MSTTPSHTPKTPPISPDLNPTEYLWDELGLRERKHDITSKTQLNEVLLIEWQNIGSKITEKLVKSMPSRHWVVIHRQGRPIKYWNNGYFICKYILPGLVSWCAYICVLSSMTKKRIFLLFPTIKVFKLDFSLHDIVCQGVKYNYLKLQFSVFATLWCISVNYVLPITVPILLSMTVCFLLLHFSHEWHLSANIQLIIQWL